MIIRHKNKLMWHYRAFESPDINHKHFWKHKQKGVPLQFSLMTFRHGTIATFDWLNRTEIAKE